MFVAKALYNEWHSLVLASNVQVPHKDKLLGRLTLHMPFSSPRPKCPGAGPVTRTDKADGAQRRNDSMRLTSLDCLYSVSFLFLHLSVCPLSLTPSLGNTHRNTRQLFARWNWIGYELNRRRRGRPLEPRLSSTSRGPSTKTNLQGLQLCFSSDIFCPSLSSPYICL